MGVRLLPPVPISLGICGLPPDFGFDSPSLTRGLFPPRVKRFLDLGTGVGTGT